jgi:predicted lipase
MLRIFLLLVAITSPLSSIARGQSKEVMQSGGNTITITSYSPRDLTDGDLAVDLLKEDWNTAREVRWDITAVIALLSEQVYSDDNETLDFLLRGMGFKKWIAIKNQTMAAHVVSGNGIAVIIFRGTNPTEIPDWYKNLSIAFISDKYGRFHSGFTDAYKLVKTDTQRYLAEIQPEKIWITGHSLGGAMAVACGVDYTLNTNYKPTLVTFGQPRYADSNGAKWIDQQFKGRYVRFVHGDDIVPSVPFYVPRLFPYAHAGNFIAINDDGLNLADSVTSTPAPTASYCGACGRMTMNARVEVYQPSIEPPPLTQQEYEDSMRSQSAMVADPSGQVTSIQFLPNYFSDHLMTGYRQLIRRYRDGQKVMSREGIEKASMGSESIQNALW